MYRSVFQNSKVALVFAGMTLFSAASMIGTSDDGGMVTDTVERLEDYRGAFAMPSQAEGQATSGGDEGQAEASVFGDYQPDAAANSPASTSAPQQQGGSPMSAPLSSTAIVAKRGSPLAGTLQSSEPEPVDTPE